MNWNPPEYVRKAAIDAIETVETNHYAVPKGRARLRNALSNWFSPLFGRQIDPDTEIVVTAGANEGVFPHIAPGLEFIQHCQRYSQQGCMPLKQLSSDQTKK